MTRSLILGLGVGAIAGGALAACGGDDDHKAPTVVSITPADGAADVWIHDPITITFSEAMAAATVAGDTITLADGTGAAVQATVALSDDAEVATVRPADDVALDGGLTLTVTDGVTDKAGNPLAPVTAHWTLPAWSRTGGLDRGVAAATPALAITDGGDPLVAWSAGGTAGNLRRILVSRAGVGGWTALGDDLGAGTGDAFVPAITSDAQGRPIALWSESGNPGMVESARWDGAAWVALSPPGSGASVAAGRAAGGDPVIAWVTGAPSGVGQVVTVRTLVGDAWQMASSSAGDLNVNGTVQSVPQVAVPSAGHPVVVFAETGGGVGAATPQIRVAVLAGAWSELPPIPLGAGPAGTFTRTTVAAAGNDIYVAYDTYSGFSWSVQVVKSSGGQAWQSVGGELDVDSPADANAPSIALDGGGAPVVAWRELVEGNWRGFVARWDGSGWRPVGGDAWNVDPARGVVRPVLALAGGRTPIVAWGDQSPDQNGSGAVHAARWNGPATPRFGRDARASIGGCAFDGSQTTLSATGCFTIANGRATPHAGLIPFDIVSELWSDGALKRRWIALPDGAQLDAPSTGAWTAPIGTMLVKEFAYESTPGDPATRRVMETRFLIHSGQGSSATGWDGYSFRWRADGSDADLLPDTASTYDWPVNGGATHTHTYPSRAQCGRCHAASNGPILGLRTGQLARRFDYDGVMAEELPTLAHLGVIVMPNDIRPFTAPHDPSQPLEARVRGYLAANCAHCHNPAGERPTRDFRWETPLASTMLCGNDSEVVQGNPSSSVIVQRISTRQNGMPPLATLATDPLAIDTVTRWIQGETNCP